LLLVVQAGDVLVPEVLQATRRAMGDGRGDSGAGEIADVTGLARPARKLRLRPARAGLASGARMPADAGAGWPQAALEEPESKPGSAALDARAPGRHWLQTTKQKLPQPFGATVILLRIFGGV